MTRPAQEESGDEDRLWSSQMVAAQGGDRAAYEALLRACVPHVKRVARRAGVTPEGVDDVVQDVLITIHRARQTYDPTLSFTAWLSAIAKRRAIDALRRRGRQVRRELSEGTAYEAFPDGAASPEEAWERNRRGQQVQDEVATLTPGQREAVELLALNGLSLDCAALATGKTKGALKVNLHRALKTLRDRFDRPT